MLRSAAVLLLSLLVPLAASAAPTALTDQQMDYITAGHNNHHNKHKDSYKLFGKTIFYYKGKLLAKDHKFEQKTFDLGILGEIGVGIESGYIVAAGHKYKRPFAKSISYVKAKGKGIDKFLSAKGAEHGWFRGKYKTKAAWGTSYGVGLVVALNDKFFYKLDRRKKIKVLKIVKYKAYETLGKATAYASKYLAPPTLRPRMVK